ncbi:hypothetical protein Tco_0737061 [Tanacetum coccineum]
MADSQPEGERAPEIWLENTGVGPREGPSEPAQLTQSTPSPTFVKENINVLRTIINEHDHQAKAKTTQRKLVYGGSEEENSDSFEAIGKSERLINKSSGTSRTKNRTRFSGKSQISLSRNRHHHT